MWSSFAWRELHPVWQMQLRSGGRIYVSGPQFGGSPPGARSSNALDTCQTPQGTVCRGYGAAAPLYGLAGVVAHRLERAALERADVVLTRSAAMESELRAEHPGFQRPVERLQDR